MVDAVKSLAANASALGSLGGGTTQLPSASQLDQIKGSIKTAHFDIYSGQDDHILRRMTIDIGIQPPTGNVNSLDLTFDLTIGKVNESQTISAPSNAKPLAGLLSQLGVSPSQLGGLGSLGVPGSGILGKGTPSSPPSGTPSGASSGAAQKYLQCVAKAGSAADLQKCQSLAP